MCRCREWAPESLNNQPLIDPTPAEFSTSVPSIYGHTETPLTQRFAAIAFENNDSLSAKETSLRAAMAENPSWFGSMGSIATWEWPAGSDSMLTGLSRILADAILVAFPGSAPWSGAFLANHRRFGSSQTMVPPSSIISPTTIIQHEPSSMGRDRTNALFYICIFVHTICVRYFLYLANTKKNIESMCKKYLCTKFVYLHTPFA